MHIPEPESPLDDEAEEDEDEDEGEKTVESIFPAPLAMIRVGE
jgi:hypothetical protein